MKSLKEHFKEKLAIAIVLAIFCTIVGGAMVIIILVASYFSSPFSPSEVSGTVDYSDCRTTINLTSDQYQSHGGRFVCNDQKTTSGKSMGGECVQVKLDGSGKCSTAYVYEKPADETCSEGYHITEQDTCDPNYYNDY